MIGKYITLSGLDGSGKTTQTKMLYDRLVKAGIDVREYSELGPNEFSLPLRAMLTEKNSNLCQRARELLFQANRAQFTSGIKQLVTTGVWAVCDRCFIDGLSYACASGESGHEQVQLIKYSIQVFPHLAVFVDVPVEQVYQRMAGRDKATSYEEAKGKEFMSKVRAEFLRFYSAAATKESSGEWFPPTLVVDGRGTPEEVHELIWQGLTKQFPELS